MGAIRKLLSTWPAHRAPARNASKRLTSEGLPPLGCTCSAADRAIPMPGAVGRTTPDS